MTAEAIDAIMHKFKKAVIERALGAEKTHHLGYPPGAAKPAKSSNHRNGKILPTTTERTSAATSLPKASYSK